MQLYNQVLLPGRAATRTCWYHLETKYSFSTKRTCAIIKAECCEYIPDLSGYISATLDDMKVQVTVMSDDNLPFWTSVLSWVKGVWCKLYLPLL